MLALAVLRYWRDVHGRPLDLARPALWPMTLLQGAQLRHMSGGGEDWFVHWIYRLLSIYKDNLDTSAHR